MYSALFLTLVNAMPDVRLDPKQAGVTIPVVYRAPGTFGYQGIINEKKNNNDQYLRSNIDNEANKRNAAKEAPLDMLPCRQDVIGPKMQFTRGQVNQMPLRWNNPHDSSCEVNIWVNGMTKVAPVKRPFHCGGGYQDQRFTFTIPKDFPGCETAAENCVVQIYGHSVEPRTYAMCIDFTLAPGAAPTPAVPGPQDVPTTILQPAIHYHDSFDTSHVDSAYSGYRGQQGEYIRDELKAVLQLQCYVGNGGLVPLGDIDKKKAQKLRDEIQKQVKAAEKLAINRNQAEQKKLDEEAKKNKTPKKCFEGEMYNVVNNPDCKRQYTNTYVTNVGYRQIYNQMLPKLKASGLPCYTPKRKDVIGKTPADPYGPFLVNRKPSMFPQGKNQKHVAQPQKPPARAPGEAPELTNLGTKYGQPEVQPVLPVDIVKEAKKVPGKPIGYNPDDIQIKPEDKTPMQQKEEEKLSIAVPAPATTVAPVASASATPAPATTVAAVVSASTAAPATTVALSTSAAPLPSDQPIPITPAPKGYEKPMPKAPAAKGQGMIPTPKVSAPAPKAQATEVLSQGTKGYDAPLPAPKAQATEVLSQGTKGYDAPLPKTEILPQGKAPTKGYDVPLPKTEILPQGKAPTKGYDVPLPKTEILPQGAPLPKTEILSQGISDKKYDNAPAPQSEILPQGTTDKKYDNAPAPQSEILPQGTSDYGNGPAPILSSASTIGVSGILVLLLVF
jgi:hypothetical protein